jgi:hypothetical protein
MSYGILTSADTQRTLNNTNVVEFGEINLWEQLDRLRQAKTMIEREMVGDMVEFSPDRQRRYGDIASMEMDEVDEGGRAETQKISAGSNVAFPLRLFQVSVGWTRKYMQNATVGEIQAQFTAAQTGHTNRIIREVKRAIFKATNTTFTDRLVDSVSLGVKAFANADSAPIPLGPNGETFTASTHTHYLYTASTSLAAADVTALVLTVAEHYATGRVRIYINSAQETAVRGLSGFIVATPADLGGYTVNPATTATSIQGPANLINLGDRLIGFYGTTYAEVWVKTWIPAGYLYAYVVGGPKPLVLRERRTGAFGLQIVANDENYPLRAETLESEFGVGCFNRVGGAVLYIDSGSASAYVSPTIT